MRYLVSGPLLVTAVLLASCGETTIDAAKGEKFIRGVVTEQAGVRVAAVACPDGLKARAGATFNCTVTGRDGSKGAVVAHQKDDKGNVNVSAPFLHVREAEAVMAGQISKQVKLAVTVKCPEIVVVKTGEQFTCTGTAQGRSRDISARLTDDTGRFRYHLS